MIIEFETRLEKYLNTLEPRGFVRCFSNDTKELIEPAFLGDYYGASVEEWGNCEGDIYIAMAFDGNEHDE